MKDDLPAIVTLSSEASRAEQYDNHVFANVNDHVVRISVMTQPYRRRCSYYDEMTLTGIWQPSTGVSREAEPWREGSAFRQTWSAPLTRRGCRPDQTN